jgi:hypothetical protein
VNNFFDEVIRLVERNDCNLKKRQPMTPATPVCTEYVFDESGGN